MRRHGPRSWTYPACLLGASLLLTACSAVAEDPAPTPAALVGTSWRALIIAGAPATPGIDSTLTFLAGDSVAGTGGCNRYHGGIAIKGDRLRVGPLASTQMACPPAAMAQEARFLQALESTVRLARDGRFLVLYGGDEAAATRLERITEPTPPAG